jgi:hypothetical protein
MNNRALAATAVGMYFLSATVLHAEDNTELIKQLQDQKALLDAQKGLIESQSALFTSQKSLIDAQYPQFPGGKGGGTTFGASVDTFHANLFAYGALNSLANRLCALPVFGNTPQVLVLSADDLDSIAATRLFKNQLNGLVAAYDDVLKTKEPEVTRVAPLAGTYAAAVALSSLADFTRLFRTDKKVSQESVTLSDSDLANEIAGCLDTVSKQHKFLLASSLMLPALLVDSPDSASLWGKYEEAAKLRISAQKLKAEDDAELEALDKAKLTTKEDHKKFVDLKSSSNRLTALLTVQTNLDSTFTGVSDNTKEPIVLRLLRGEALLKQINNDPKPLLLTTNIVLKGGFSVVSQSIWRADKFYSRGGLAVSYRVENHDGKVLDAGILRAESAPSEVKF